MLVTSIFGNQQFLLFPKHFQKAFFSEPLRWNFVVKVKTNEVHIYCHLVLPQYLMLSKKKLLFQILSSLEIINHRISYLLRKMSIIKIRQ